MFSSVLSFILPRLPELVSKFFEQIYLVGLAVWLAMACGIPIGIWVRRMPKFKGWVLGIANVLQTIPSLALLGFLLPLFGVGATPAIIALTLYALLPIIRNTVTGLENVAPDMLEAAKGLGFTYWQRLMLVELPLALPVIVAGIRVSVAMSVGIATLAAFIGAGGLGDFINRGLATNDTRLILLGAIPAAILALLLDSMIARLERSLTQRRKQPLSQGTSWFSRKRAIIAACLLMTGGGIVVWGHWERGPVIRIATKNFAEQLILGEVMAQLLEAHTDLRIERRFNLGGTLLIHQAMLQGEVDIYPEYTGTAYLLLLGCSESGTAEEIYQRVQADYLSRFHLQWLSPFGFENTNTIAVSAELAQRYGLAKVSDLKPIAHQLVMALPSENVERADGLPALAKAYGFTFKQYKEMEIGLMYKALNAGQVDGAILFTTDGRLLEAPVILLKDDQHFFLPYYAAPIVRADLLKQYPEIKAVLERLSNRLNNRLMQQMNYQVEHLQRAPAVVAREFLHQQGLL